MYISYHVLTSHCSSVVSIWKLHLCTMPEGAPMHPPDEHFVRTAAVSEQRLCGLSAPAQLSGTAAEMSAWKGQHMFIVVRSLQEHFQCWMAYSSRRSDQRIPGQPAL